MIRQSRTAARWAYTSPEIARQMRHRLRAETLTDRAERIVLIACGAGVVALALYGVYLAWQVWL